MKKKEEKEETEDNNSTIMEQTYRGYHVKKRAPGTLPLGGAEKSAFRFTFPILKVFFFNTSI